jgi:hypothetical protein
MVKGDDDDDDGGKGRKKDKKSHQITRLWDEDNSRVGNLGQVIDKLDEDYLHDTGTMITRPKSPARGTR